MNQIVASEKRITAMTPVAIEKVRKLEDMIRDLPQVCIETDHVIHGGMYARTVTLPAGAVITGALIKVPTILIVSGHVRVFLDDEAVDIHGYKVLAASAIRKQAFLVYEDTVLTMIFTTEADTVEACEDQFTDEADQLMSRWHEAVNTITITGE